MSKIPLNLYQMLAEMVLLPMVKDIIKICDGNIYANSINWKISTTNGQNIFYTIDLVAECVYFQGLNGENKNELVNNVDESLFVLNHLLATIKLSMLVSNTPDLKDPVLAIRLAQNPKNIPFHVFDSMS